MIKFELITPENFREAPKILLASSPNRNRDFDANR
jgi:hypothetical protein